MDIRRILFIGILLNLAFNSNSNPAISQKWNDLSNQIEAVSVKSQVEGAAKSAYLDNLDGSTPSSAADSWGTPIRLLRNQNFVTAVSAGPDHRYGTADDIKSTYGKRKVASINSETAKVEETEPILDYNRDQEKEFKLRLRKRLALERQSKRHPRGITARRVKNVKVRWIKGHSIKMHNSS